MQVPLGALCCLLRSAAGGVVLLHVLLLAMSLLLSVCAVSRCFNAEDCLAVAA